jgi:cytochrome b pre-mRNA-processing protein 3
MASSVLLRSLRNQKTSPGNLSYSTSRYITAKLPQKSQPKKPSGHAPKRSWLTRKVEESPIWRALFFRFAKLLGYGSPKQLAGRRSFAIYEKICAVKPDEDRAFWQDGEFTL